MSENFSKGQLPNQGFHITTRLEQVLCGGKCPAANLCEIRGISYKSPKCIDTLAKVSALRNNSNQ